MTGVVVAPRLASSALMEKKLKVEEIPENW